MMTNDLYLYDIFFSPIEINMLKFYKFRDFFFQNVANFRFFKGSRFFGSPDVHILVLNRRNCTVETNYEEIEKKKYLLFPNG